jgi:hypothetical protein
MMANPNELQLQFPIATDTLRDAQEQVRKHMDTGSVCPCCQQQVRRYQFSLSEKNVYFLIMLRRYLAEFSKDWMHIDRLAEYAKEPIKGGTSFSILAWWGLIEEMTNEDTTKKTSGFWRPTQLGMDWLDGKAVIPKYVYSYNQTITTEPSDPLISVSGISWKRFQYDVLMSWKGHAVWAASV